MKTIGIRITDHSEHTACLLSKPTIDAEIVLDDENGNQIFLHGQYSKGAIYHEATQESIYDLWDVIAQTGKTPENKCEQERIEHLTVSGDFSHWFDKIDLLIYRKLEEISNA